MGYDVFIKTFNTYHDYIELTSMLRMSINDIKKISVKEYHLAIKYKAWKSYMDKKYSDHINKR